MVREGPWERGHLSPGQPALQTSRRRVPRWHEQQVQRPWGRKAWACSGTNKEALGAGQSEGRGVREAMQVHHSGPQALALRLSETHCTGGLCTAEGGDLTWVSLLGGEQTMGAEGRSREPRFRKAAGPGQGQNPRPELLEEGGLCPQRGGGGSLWPPGGGLCHSHGILDSVFTDLPKIHRRL